MSTNRVNSKTPQDITDYNLETLEAYDLEGPITTAIEILQELQEKYTSRGYHTVWLDYYCDDDYGNSFEVCGTKTETQEEVEKRLAVWKKNLAKKKARENREKAQKEQREKKLYLKLKDKYE